MNASELKALQAPLVILVIVLGLAAGVIYQLDQTFTASKRELAQQQSQMREARTRLQRSGEEKEVIVRYLPNYQYLQRVGFVGDEQRLNWLEGLRLSNQEAQLFGVQYQIGSQQPYPFAAELNAGQLTIHQSLMKLNFQLLHEGDLMSFLAALGKQGAGFFAVNECKLNRITSGASIRYQPNLAAECDIAWITLRPATAGDRK
jgi:Tfp pilus assembly protein PilV